MRKKRFALILAACLLAQSCPYVVTAEPISKQESNEEVAAASDEVILSGDCSIPEKDWWCRGESHVEWKVVKTDDDEKLKLIISGNGQMKDYTKDASLIHPIDLELDDLGIDDAYISEIEVCEGVTSIGSFAFWNSNIERVSLPSGINSIRYNSFEDCKKLKDINLPDTISSICNYAFLNCKQLNSIRLPTGLTSLGHNAFNGSGLKSLILPNNSTDIQSGAFFGCSNLKDVIFPNEWTGTIASYTFFSCNTLEELRIPEGVKTLTSDIWSNCPHLKTLYLPHSLASLTSLTRNISHRVN